MTISLVKFLCLAGLAVLLFTCSDTEPGGYTVYIVGQQSNAASTETNMVVWVNGKIQYTTPNNTFLPGRMTVHRNQVYVAGSAFDGTRYTPAYWNNNQVHLLAEDIEPAYVQANDIDVTGNDVYVAGGLHNGTQWIPYYWRNGEAHPLPITTYAGGVASVMVIAGQDVYVGGEVTHASGRTPVYWKNGQGPVLVADATLAFLDLQVAGTYVYVLTEDYLATPYPQVVLWKNGTRENVTDGLAPLTGAFSLLVNNEARWVSGYVTNQDYRTVATVWKNGVATTVGEEMPGSLALAIAKGRNDVMVVGLAGDDAFYAVNGEVIKLPKEKERASAHHLVVVE